jgi:hypothetical protein
MRVLSTCAPAINDLKFKKVANCGDLSIEFLGFRQACGGRNPEKITQIFLERLISNIIVNSVKFSDSTSKKNKNYRDYIYRYSERSLHTVICPSIFDITPLFMIEQPSQRKMKGKDAYTGHIDYKVTFRNITYAIELKHTRLTYGKTPKEQVGKHMKTAVDQLKSIKGSEMEFLCQDDDKYYIKIALELVTFRKGSERLDKLTQVDDKDTIKETYLGLRDVEPLKNANMFALWLPAKRLTKPYEYTNRSVKYPALAFLVQIVA